MSRGWDRRKGLERNTPLARNTAVEDFPLKAAQLGLVRRAPTQSAPYRRANLAPVSRSSDRAPSPLAPFPESASPQPTRDTGRFSRYTTKRPA